MQQWEYLSGTVEDDAEASRLGMEGWELVGVVNIPGGSDPIYHFKRQLRQYKTTKEGIYKDYNGYLQGEQEGRKRGVRDAYAVIIGLLGETHKEAAELILQKFDPPTVNPSPTTREDLISGGGTEREKELFQMGYEWGLKNREKILDYTK